jgi:hypothetical protein
MSQSVLVTRPRSKATSSACRAVLVECCAHTVDLGRALGVPGVPLIAPALNAHRPADRLRQQCRIDPGVAGVLVSSTLAAGSDVWWLGRLA